MDLLTSVPGHDGIAWNLAWSPSGRFLASCGEDRTVKIWMLTQGDRLLTEGLPSDLGRGKPENISLVCVGHLGGPDESSPFQKATRSIAWNLDGRSLAVACFDSNVSILDLVPVPVPDSSSAATRIHVNEMPYEPRIKLHVSAVLSGHESEVKSVAFSSSGRYLATCSRDKSVWVWDGDLDGGSNSDFECAAVLAGHTADVKSVAWSPVRDRLLSCSYDGSIRVWEEDLDVEDFSCIGLISGIHSTVWCCSFCKSGEYLVSVGEEGTLVVWQCIEPAPGSIGKDPIWKSVKIIPQAHPRPIYGVAWSTVESEQDSNWIASCGGDNVISVWERRRGESEEDEFQLELRTRQNEAHRGDVNAVAWHPKIPGILASCGDDGSIRMWHVGN